MVLLSSRGSLEHSVARIVKEYGWAVVEVLPKIYALPEKEVERQTWAWLHPRPPSGSSEVGGEEVGLDLQHLRQLGSVLADLGQTHARICQRQRAGAEL